MQEDTRLFLDLLITGINARSEIRLRKSSKKEGQEYASGVQSGLILTEAEWESERFYREAIEGAPAEAYEDYLRRWFTLERFENVFQRYRLTQKVPSRNSIASFLHDNPTDSFVRRVEVVWPDARNEFHEIRSTETAGKMPKGYTRKQLEKLRDKGPATLNQVRAAKAAGVTRQDRNWRKRR